MRYIEIREERKRSSSKMVEEGYFSSFVPFFTLHELHIYRHDLCNYTSCDCATIHHVIVLLYIMWLHNYTSCDCATIHHVIVLLYIMWLCYYTSCDCATIHYVIVLEFILLTRQNTTCEHYHFVISFHVNFHLLYVS